MFSMIGSNRSVWLVAKICLLVISLVSFLAVVGYKRIETKKLLSIDSVEDWNVGMWAWHVLDEYSRYDEGSDGWRIVNSYLESGRKFDFDNYQYIISFDHEIDAFVYSRLIPRSLRRTAYPIYKTQKGKVLLYRIDQCYIENPYEVW